MGICSSCLGLGRRGSESENQEASRLLYDESYRSQYGSVQQQQQRAVNQPDPESLRREREALETICHAMSDDVVDIFTALPEPLTQNRKAPTHLVPQANGSEKSRADPGLSIYSSIKRGKAGPISSALNTNKYGWEAAKTAIVGAGDQDPGNSEP